LNIVNTVTAFLLVVYITTYTLTLNKTRHFIYSTTLSHVTDSTCMIQWVTLLLGWDRGWA